MFYIITSNEYDEFFEDQPDQTSSDPLSNEERIKVANIRSKYFDEKFKKKRHQK